MPFEIKKEIALEIAHVLFIDIVGYSKLLIDEQRDYSRTLNEVVRETDSFRAADAAGKLTRLPTGDGRALVFATTPDAPVSCALQISKALRSHPELRVRIANAELRCLETAPLLGSAPRRSALRKNRRLARAERGTLISRIVTNRTTTLGLLRVNS